MDRAIPQETIRRERLKRWGKLAGIILVLLVGIILLITYMRASISLKGLRLSTAEVGTIEVSVSASGRVVPAFEEIITAPISSRIVEVYKRAGDAVEADSPLLRLDLTSLETDYHKQLDELKMRQYRLQQLRIKNASTLSNAEMQIKVGDMKLNQMLVEVRNERYLDSIGAGTTDKVREVQLRYRVAELEQAQARSRLDNDRLVSQADARVMELELEIFRKTLAETKRLLDDAQIRSPRRGVLTYINTQIGAQVAPGGQVAILSDLSHFRIDAEIADSYGDRIRVGSRATIKVGSEELSGVVSNLTPLSKNGVIQFSVSLDEDAHPRLRSGLKTDVHVMNAVKEDVLRIANGPYYNGRGAYEIFVRQAGELEKRSVQLGESSYQWVEVISGLSAGDEVVVSDMSQYKSNSKLKLDQ
ncbi:MAG: HlyD family efflux transporter periplasmic adaptor subunit [Porphyromonadaceae bacterium]|nr:HlyD family efflux transporter periplasmic adaptor subunit [Porphyromonadaceae bacterium]